MKKSDNRSGLAVGATVGAAVGAATTSPLETAAPKTFVSPLRRAGCLSFFAGAVFPVRVFALRRIGFRVFQMRLHARSRLYTAE